MSPSRRHASRLPSRHLTVMDHWDQKPVFLGLTARILPACQRRAAIQAQPPSPGVILIRSWRAGSCASSMSPMEVMASCFPGRHGAHAG